MRYLILNDEAQGFEKIWQAIVSFFDKLGQQFDGLLKDALNIDGRILEFYNNYVAPLSEVIKLLGLLLLLLIIILGTISLIKKSFKLVIVLAVIVLIIYVVSLI